MLADPERFPAYCRAIQGAVRPGNTVAEIGCGPGVFAMLACQVGAKRVYAIESEPVIELARQLARANRFDDRIDFFEGDSRKVSLPERVDVLVFDLRGVLPLFQEAVSTIEDARRRFLAPGGLLIPSRDELKAGIVEAQEHYSRLTQPWQSKPGLDLSCALAEALNAESYHTYFKAEQLLTNPQTWFVVNYSTGADALACARVRFRALRDGTGHGICIWFEAHLFGEHGYSTGPGSSKEGISGQMFLPWPEAVSIHKNLELEITLNADLVDGDYVWRWETIIPASGASPARHFRQSTFYGEQLSPASLRRREAGFVPTLSESGQADRWLLHAMDGKASLREIAQSAAQHFPKIFPRWEDALRRAADLAAQFSR